LRPDVPTASEQNVILVSTRFRRLQSPAKPSGRVVGDFHEKASRCQAVFLGRANEVADCRPTGGTVSFQAFSLSFLERFLGRPFVTADRRPTGGAECCRPEFSNRRFALLPSIWSASHFGKRSPIAFAKPRAVFTKLVRTAIRAARTRMTINAVCAFSLRCWMGRSNWGSMRASRAKVCASKRSSFQLLSVISFTCRRYA